MVVHRTPCGFRMISLTTQEPRFDGARATNGRSLFATVKAFFSASSTEQASEIQGQETKAAGNREQGRAPDSTSLSKTPPPERAIDLSISLFVGESPPEYYGNEQVSVDESEETRKKIEIVKLVTYDRQGRA